MILISILVGRGWWKFAEEYLVPLSTIKPSQHRSATRYINRQLPLKGRTRGDVGQV